jgi:hypothetical protein
MGISIRLLIWNLLWVGPRREGAGAFGEKHRRAAVEGADAPLLGRCELWGNLELDQLAQGLADLLETVLDCRGLRGQSVGLVPAEGGPWVAHQGALVAAVGNGVGGQ